MLTYSLGFRKVHGATNDPIQNYRAIMLKSQNFNRRSASTATCASFRRIPRLHAAPRFSTQSCALGTELSR